ncbi:MAG: DNA internalization-related competence protein ComEC/Rec2 [Bacilli bacterium]|nr:DNA internalization-related competence protein ComEC/Rec2 [Bacilli bacterium]
MTQFSLKLRKILLYDKLYYLLLIISLIYIFIYYKNYIPHHNYDINETKFILTINDIKIDGNKLNLSFKENLVSTYYFKTKEEKEYFINNYSLADKLNIEGSLSIPTENTIKNTFNYKNYLYYKKVNYILKIENYSLNNKNKNIFLKIKNFIIKRVETIENNEYLYAFILGKSSFLDREAYNNYKINGVTHLFALSGLHVSLFSNILLFLLTKIGLKEKGSFIITSLFLIFFSFIASFSPSILRATIFFILSSLNKIYYTFIKPKNILYTTFFILILINPFYIFNTGFILSFTITFFILLTNENYQVKGSIKQTLFISLISFASSLPIILNMSYEINVIGFLNNLIFIPFVSYIVFPISLVTMFIPYLSNILLFLTNIMELLSKISTSILNITIIFSKLSYLEIIIYYVLLILIIKKKTKLIKYMIIFIIYLYLKPMLNNDEFIYVTDVSQGDSILIHTKTNKNILIDTGGKLSYKEEDWKKKNNNFNIMTSSMIPFYKSLGIKKFDYLIITHGDHDHMGEAINLINNFKVKKAIFNCGTYNKLEQNLIQLLEIKNIPYEKCIENLNVDNYNLEFLNTRDYNNENENSSVIYTKINNTKILLMGDAGVEREKDILEKYDLKNIDILKVGHHGSDSSSSKEFIERINPKECIIPVGVNNKYGHPKKSVIDTLDDYCNIYRTDINGSIEIKLKNNDYKIKTISP